MTKLFTDKITTTIAQGTVGDCYLLAILDCLMNTDPEGLAFIKSLFLETEAHIVVRIKRTHLSNNLTHKDKKKYNFSIDPLTNEDVFIINRDKCQEIDDAQDSVQTDSLAVKILERICSYYFYNNWQTQGCSLAAHSIREMCENSLESPKKSIEFIAEWLSLDVHLIPNANLFMMLKKIHPTSPIYLSMMTETARHAFRVDRIEERDSQTTCLLINPWNNQIKEPHVLTEIMNKEPSIYLLKTHEPQYKLAYALLQNADFMQEWIQHIDVLSKRPLDKHSEDIFHTQELKRQKMNITHLELMLAKLVTMCNLTPLCIKPLQLVIDYYKKNHDTLCNPLPNYHRVIAIKYTPALNTSALIDAPSPSEKKFNQLKPTPTSAFLAPHEQALIKKINNILISFEACSSKQDIENHKIVLREQLDKELEKKRKYLLVTNSVFSRALGKDVIKAKENCLERLNTLAEQAILNLPLSKLEANPTDLSP